MSDPMKTRQLAPVESSSRPIEPLSGIDVSTSEKPKREKQLAQTIIPGLSLRVDHMVTAGYVLALLEVIGTSILFAGSLHFGSSSSSRTLIDVYTVHFFILFLIRAVQFYQWHMHHFLLDWCYMANIVMILWLKFAPKDHAIALTVFAMITGPTLLGTVVFSCKLVLHDLQRATSVYIHVIPAWIVYVLRWSENQPPLPATMAVCDGNAWCNTDQDTIDFAGNLPDFFWFSAAPLILGLIQTAISYTWINAPCNSTLRQKEGYENSALHMQVVLKRVFTAIQYHKWPRLLQAISMVCLGNLCFVFPMCMATYVLYHHRWLHMTYLVVVTLMAMVWGGQYYGYKFGIAAALKPKQAQDRKNKQAKVQPLPANSTTVLEK